MERQHLEPARDRSHSDRTLRSRGRLRSQFSAGHVRRLTRRCYATRRHVDHCRDYVATPCAIYATARARISRRHLRQRAQSGRHVRRRVRHDAPRGHMGVERRLLDAASSTELAIRSLSSRARVRFDARRSGALRRNERRDHTAVGYLGVERNDMDRETDEPYSPARAYHALAEDAARHELVLFGGVGNSERLSDTWTWNGSAWSLRIPTASPSALADTWAWNGTTWTQRVGAPPQARGGHGMAYDSSYRQLVVFGGETASGRTNDTWANDGSVWSARFPGAPPSARFFPTLTFDAERQQVVLFGGISSTGVAQNDTWLHLTLGGTCTSGDDCVSGSCTDGVCCNAASCGTCATCAGTSPGRCAPVTNAEDPDSCSVQNGRSCNSAGACKTAVGVPATNAADCASGLVADGVCCDQACDTGCVACRADLKESGTRSGVCDSAKAGTDPKSACAEDDRATCGRNGACDGRGGCARYANDTPCGPVACLDDRSTSRICDGLGECSASAKSVSCGLYVCRESEGCLTACTSDADCGERSNCDVATRSCVANEGASCDGDHTLVSPDRATRTDCGLYRCEGDACKTSCTSKTDCANDALCNFDGKCVTFQEGEPPPSDGGCSTTNMRTRMPVGGASAFLLWLALRTLRSRRSMRAVAITNITSIATPTFSGTTRRAAKHRFGYERKVARGSRHR